MFGRNRIELRCGSTGSPGAQLRLTDADGHRLTASATNTPPGGPHRQLADLELHHRRRARAEDRIRNAKGVPRGRVYRARPEVDRVDGGYIIGRPSTTS
ncbi:hypothetical protein CFP66_33585 [Pseudonocardia sp. MH-G8]|nr:hypothetical protein CFP66_33585 [Pseudonocardia sp. MH-G8]